MKEELYKGYTIKIEQDTDAESPREWDNLGIMAYKHQDYILGDEKIPEYYLDEKGYEHYLDSDEEIKTWLKQEKGATLILPLYLYDHSGITIRTVPFGDRWDSGQVGYVYTTKEAIKKEFATKRLTLAILKKALRLLEGEVTTFDDYLTNNIYGYTILDRYGAETDESCWGFYGYDNCLQEAKRQVDWLITQEPKAREKSILKRSGATV